MDKLTTGVENLLNLPIEGKSGNCHLQFLYFVHFIVFICMNTHSPLGFVISIRHLWSGIGTQSRIIYL